MKLNENDIMPKRNEKGNGIIETQPSSENKEWRDIGNQLTRNCPICNKFISYKNVYYKNRADKNKKQCKTCCKTGNKNGKYGTGHLITGINHPMYGKHHSDISKKIMSQKRKKYCSLYPDKNPSLNPDIQLKKSKKFRGENNPMHGKRGDKNPFFAKRHSHETRRKMRMYAIERIEKSFGLYDGMVPSVGKGEEKYFFELEREKNWNGIFYGKNKCYKQYHIKHLGYFVDYYEPTLNIVVEYDENDHYTQSGEIKHKDLIRMQEIKEYLKCKFYRYNERKNILNEY